MQYNSRSKIARPDKFRMTDRPILIVDDEPINLAKLREILEPQYRLMFALSGDEALEIVARCPPSLILLDIQMPNINGFKVCQALKANPKFESIPVIFVTTLAEQGYESAGFEAGGVDYLTKPVCADVVRARVKTHLSLVRSTQLEKSYRQAVFMLGKAGHYNDNDTGLHIWRMAAYSRSLAESLNWPESECELLELAAAMHDTGKIGLPDAILRKPGKLDADEWRIMQSHARIGYEILSKSDAPLFRMAADIALHHHEKWDGKGYPEGLTGENIPEPSRIVAIADVFDALSMQRPYKEAWPLEKIVSYMEENAGRHFDPELLNRFIDILPLIIEIQTKWNKEEEATRLRTKTRIDFT